VLKQERLAGGISAIGFEYHFSWCVQRSLKELVHMLVDYFLWPTQRRESRRLGQQQVGLFKRVLKDKLRLGLACGEERENLLVTESRSLTIAGIGRTFFSFQVIIAYNQK
jgi:hypothetical protein